MTWRAVLLTQSLAVFFALAPWLEEYGLPWQPSLLVGLMSQCIGAAFILVGALKADQYVRNGMSVLRAFAQMLIGASLAASLIVFWVQGRVPGDPLRELANILTVFFSVSVYWGIPMLVYLNRSSAARLLATVEENELRRVQSERRLVESDLAAAEAEINPAAVLEQLGRLRALYAGGDATADAELTRLISDLRDTVARCRV